MPVITKLPLTLALTPLLAAGLAAPTARADSDDPHPHADHVHCHGPGGAKSKACASILAAEGAAFTAWVQEVPQVTIIDDNGERRTGRRDLYDTSQVTGSTDETTFSAQAWLRRFSPNAAGRSAHTEWENDRIDSCDQYAYKRFYQTNRWLDALGSFRARGDYTGALRAVLDDGLPGLDGAQPVPRLAHAVLRDHSGRPISPFSRTRFTGTPLHPMDPHRVGNRPRNPFFNAPFFAGVGHGVPRDPAWQATLQAALTRSLAEPMVHYPATPSPETGGLAGEWWYANQMRSHPHITSLSPAERDDIAERVDRMAGAVARALSAVDDCIVREYDERTRAVGNVIPASGVSFQDYVESKRPGAGVTYPVDRVQLELVERLFDPVHRTATLTSVLAANPSAKAAQWAATSTGALLRAAYAAAPVAAKSVHVGFLASSIGAAQLSLQGTGSPHCALSAHFDEVRELLVKEYLRGDAGCMSANRRCDFSPPLFVDELVQRLAHDAPGSTAPPEPLTIDVAKETCLAYIGSSFDSPLLTVPPAARRHGLGLFEAYLEDRKQKLDEILRDIPQRSSLPRSIGDRRDGGSSFGDPARFGAEYKYAAEWGVNVVERASSGQNAGMPCRLGGRVAGRLEAHAAAFGKREELVNAGLEATTPQAGESAGTYKAWVTMMGDDIYGKPEEVLPLTSVSPQPVSDNSYLELARKTIVAGFIPITFTAGVGFDYGYELDLRYTPSECVASPTLALRGRVTPFVGAFADVTAYVDLFVVGAGLRGKLTLIEARLPLTASLTVTPHATEGLVVDARSSLTLVLQQLSGAISFIVKVIGITVYEHELFSWRGPQQRVKLWSDEATFPLRGFALLNN